MQEIEFTDNEIEELKMMIREWISEGFCSTPYPETIASIIRKLGLGD